MKLRTLLMEGIHARVVSVPPWELFEWLHQAYRDRVLPPHVTVRISCEHGVTTGWDRYINSRGRSIEINTFGASAPQKALQKKFGFTPEHLMVAVKEQRASGRSRGQYAII